MTIHKKLLFLTGLFSMIGMAGCNTTEEDNPCEGIEPSCIDANSQWRCGEHGMMYIQMCSQGCMVDASGKSICKGEEFCDPECETGYYCDYDTCKPGTKPVDPEPSECVPACASNEVCVNGECRLPGTCSTKADCANNQDCINGKCETVTTDSCTTKQDCPSGQDCVEGQCKPETPTQTCVDTGCTKPGEYCNESNGLCTVDCRTEGAIACATGDLCNETTGKCFTPECTDKKPCADSKFTCENYACVPATKDCKTDGCPDTYECNEETNLCEKTVTSCIKDGCPSETDFCNTVTGICEATPEIIECPALTITDTANTCEKSGSGKKLVLRGDVLGLEKTWKGGSVVIEGEKITYVGCDPDMTDATVVTCPDAVISPSFINGHEHLTYSNAKPGSWGDERFDHRYDWRKGANGHKKVPGGQTGDNGVVELRSIMGGTTSIFGSGSVSGLARNLDTQTINGVKSIYQTFPLGDSSKNYTSVSSCTDYEYHKSVINFDDSCPYGPHIAEGINQGAVNELRCLNGQGTDGQGTGAKNIFTSHLAIIHGIAATPDIISMMASSSTKLIWSPRTNVSLYGDTAQAPLFDSLGVTIGLGTDWIYSGSANMLRELACIDGLNTNYYGKYFSDYKLWKMPTYNNAVAFGLEGSLGQIKAGHLADIAVFKKIPNVRESYRAVIEAENKDVTLVMIGGNMMYGDANIMDKGDSVDVCGVAKKVNVNANGGSYSYSDLSKAAQYPLFFCDTPENEPTCTPMRTRAKDTTDQQTTLYAGDFTAANDADGDGIPDDVDNCPTIFNPIRPQDTDRKQADFDGDGIGDVCDPYPTCAKNDDTCPKFNANDRDEDGIENLKDNCPDVANPDQTDSDGDGIGDACDKCDDRYDKDGDTIPDNCDACPDDGNNEDGTGCSLKLTSVYDIRMSHIEETMAEGLVKTQGIVTAIAQKYDGSALTGFFIQDPEKQAGLYVYGAQAAATVKPGDLVEVYGSLVSYYSLLEIKSPTVTVKSSNHEVKPLTLTAAQTTQDSSDTGSTNPYDSMLVHVSGLTVNDYNQPEGNKNAGSKSYVCTDANGDTAYLDDYIMGTKALEAAVEIGTTYDVTGILVYDFGRSKIAPLNADAIISGLGVKAIAAPQYAAFGSDVTVTVTMNSKAEASTTLNIECTNATCPATTTVAANADTATFTATMANQSPATIKVTYESTTKEAQILTFDASAPVSVATITPATLSIMIGKTDTVSVMLSRPSDTDTVVTLASSDTSVATVPSSITIAAGDTEGSFDVTMTATEADKSATISATVGSTTAQTMTVTSKGIPDEMVETFNSLKDNAKTGYSNPQKITREDGIVVDTASGIFNKSTDANGSVFFGADDNTILVLNGKCGAGNQIKVSNLPAGVGTVTFDARLWNKDADAYIDILADETVVLTAQKITGYTATKYTYTVNAPNATSFTVRMSNDTKYCTKDNKPRVGLDDLSWTTGK